jgi:hypothetical protein
LCYTIVPPWIAVGEGPGLQRSLRTWRSENATAKQSEDWDRGTPESKDPNLLPVASTAEEHPPWNEPKPCVPGPVAVQDVTATDLCSPEAVSAERR